MKVKLYVEGGGDSDALHIRCRQGFRCFLEKAGFGGCMPRIVACGGRQEAYERFKTACESQETALLLIDSEDCVSVSSPWEHLSNQQGDKFIKPQGVDDDQCHLMVVCMESWFLADKDALEGFFGPGFKIGALPKNTNIEAVSKFDIYSGLQKATSHCKTKAPYGKGEHSFKILLLISPEKVVEASPWAKRFIGNLNTLLKG